MSSDDYSGQLCVIEMKMFVCKWFFNLDEFRTYLDMHISTILEGGPSQTSLFHIVQNNDANLVVCTFTHSLTHTLNRSFISS